jgi:aminoglycoside phosphotransferase (APT) family kinase protein
LQEIGQAPDGALRAPAADLPGDRLAAWLADHVQGFSPLVSVDKFAGGQSNPTYRITDGTRALVLRRKPFGQLLPSAHAVEREYRLIAALHPTGFPVPRPYALCEDPEVIGAPFYVMAMVPGRTFWDGTLPELAREQRWPVYESMIDTLAALHRLEPEALGIGDFGAPGNYFERQVRRWTKQYRASQTDDIPEMERLIEWLPRTLPPQDRVSIIHGDYRIDNMIFAPDGKVAAVVDWELATLGDPLADFAYLAMNWVMPSGGRRSQLGGLDLAELGIPDLDAVTERYCTKSGRSGVPSLDWHFAYCLFRLAGIVQGIKKRALDGNASSKDAGEQGARVPLLAKQAWEFARRAGAPQ